LAALPKPPGKRADLPRRSDFTREFAKDWTRLTRSGRFNMAQLKQVMLLLVANEGPLPAEWRDHALTANWADHRECHVGGDFLLSTAFQVTARRPQSSSSGPGRTPIFSSNNRPATT
jgi:addiction module RelE/StbE family toxin